MKAVAQWSAIAVLIAVYVFFLFAVLHPKVSLAYKAYYIDRTASEWNPEHYPGTPEQGIVFSRKGLPAWIDSTYGLSFRDFRGRWTDGDIARVPALQFTTKFSGALCLQFTATPASALAGKTFAVEMGDQTKSVNVIPHDLAEYQLQFEEVQGADRLRFLFPGKLPRESEVDRGNNDTRRLGLEFTTLRILPGTCPSEQTAARP